MSEPNPKNKRPEALGQESMWAPPPQRSTDFDTSGFARDQSPTLLSRTAPDGLVHVAVPHHIHHHHGHHHHQHHQQHQQVAAEADTLSSPAVLGSRPAVVSCPSEADEDQYSPSHFKHDLFSPKNDAREVAFDPRHPPLPPAVIEQLQRQSDAIMAAMQSREEGGRVPRDEWCDDNEAGKQGPQQLH